MYPPLSLPAVARVMTKHFLEDGYEVRHDEYEFFKDRFSWISKEEILERILALRSRTDNGYKSVIAFYEKDHRIREFVNVEDGFSPLSFS